MTEHRIKFGYSDCSFGQIHYACGLASGHSDAAPLVLLNPRSRSCYSLVSVFESERQVYIVDIPAYGASSPPPSPCTMQDLAETIDDFITEVVGRPVHICGFHTGAKVATAFACNYPEHTLSLCLFGKSHSLIPNQEKRNHAMREQVAKTGPDIAVVAMESFHADDNSHMQARKWIYEANFAFDLSGALSAIDCPVLIAEFTSDDEDLRHGRQAAGLAAFARSGSTLSLAEKENMGLTLYAGIDTVANAIRNFIA